MSLQTNLSIFLIENRLIRDFLYLEMYKARDQAKAVQGDPAKAEDLIRLVHLLQDVIGLFRDNTCIVDGLNVLNRINEFFTDDFPMILTFENMYRDVLDVIHEYKCRNRLLEPPVPASGPLPAVIGGLTRFDGRLIEWRYFHVNFITYVHSMTTLAHEVRFNYLLSLLSGDALRVVQVFPPFAENYVAAWTTLQYHFENTYVLGLSYLETIYKSQQPCPDLKTFADVFKENVAQLRAIWRGDLKRIVEFYANSRLSLSSMSSDNVEHRGRCLNLKWLKDYVDQGCETVDGNRRRARPNGDVRRARTATTGSSRLPAPSASADAAAAASSRSVPSTGPSSKRYRRYCCKSQQHTL